MIDQTHTLTRPTTSNVDALSEQEALAFKNMFAKLVDDYRHEYLIARPTTSRPASPASEP